MTTTIRIISALLALFFAGASHAQTTPPNYPTRPVRVIVAYPPGGPTDLIARVVAQNCGALGQQFYVENLAGAGGAIGAGIAANAPPDGHTLFITTNDFAVGATTTKLSYDPVKNFAPISIVFRLAGGDREPVAAGKDHAGAARTCEAEPGKHSYAGMSIGFGQLTSERLFRLESNVDVIRVPFQGAAPLITSTVGGHTPIAFIALPPAAPMIKEGKLRALAVTSAKRSPEFPDGTTTESGFPGQESALLIGFCGSCWHAAADHRRAATPGRSHCGASRRQAKVGHAAIHAGRQHARSLCRPDQVRSVTWSQVVKDLGMKVE